MGVVVDLDKGGLEIANVSMKGAQASRYLAETAGLPLGRRLKYLGMRYEHIRE